MNEIYNSDFYLGRDVPKETKKLIHIILEKRGYPMYKKTKDRHDSDFEKYTFGFDEVRGELQWMITNSEFSARSLIQKDVTFWLNASYFSDRINWATDTKLDKQIQNLKDG
jgi:hypothetical protein